MVFPNLKHSVSGESGRNFAVAVVVAAILASTALVALAWFAGTAAANPLAPQTPQSPNAEDAATAYWFGLVIAIVLIVAVNAALIYALVKFRSRRSSRPAPANATATEPGRRENLLPVAMFGVVALVAIVVGVTTAYSARTIDFSGDNALVAANNTYAELGTGELPEYIGADGEPAGDLDAPGATNQGVDLLSVTPVRIKAIGQRWLWRFEYPGNNPQGTPRFSYGELVVPVDTPVILDVTSVDVAHTWWIPSLGGQVQALPGSLSRTWFRVAEEGIYEGASTVFSGAAFPTMRGSVRAVDPVEYRAWVEQLESDLLAAGEEVQSIVGTGTGSEEEE